MILRYYDYALAQLLPIITLIYERVKMLESSFHIKFGREEIMSLLKETEGICSDIPVVDTQQQKENAWIL